MLFKIEHNAFYLTVIMWVGPLETFVNFYVMES